MKLTARTLRSTLYLKVEIPNPADRPTITHPDSPDRSMTVEALTVGWHWSHSDDWHALDIRVHGKPATDHAGNYKMAFTSMRPHEWPQALTRIIDTIRPDDVDPADASWDEVIL